MAHRIYLLDAMNFIHRSYHASTTRAPMMTKAGMHTGTVYLFNQMLRRLFEDLEPKFLVACCDVKEPTWQDEISKDMPVIQKWSKKGIEKYPYLGYKVGRIEHTKEFLDQIPYIYRLFEAYGIPVCAVPGYEADDLLGSLARIAVTEDPARMVSVISNDKDMLQLVNSNVQVMNPVKGVFTSSTVKTEIGVTPEQIADVMALRGDTSDNVPGAPGIGDKGSVELIQKWGTLDQLYYNLHLVDKTSYRESLRLNEAVVRLSKRLVTIDCNAPLPWTIESMKIQPVQQEKLDALMAELEFKAAPRNWVESSNTEEDPELMALDMSEAL